LLAVAGTALAFGLATYGCSDDPPPGGGTPGKDGGGGQDTSTAQDTGNNNDTGTQQDTGTDSAPLAPTARAAIAPTSDGGTVQGTATFTEGTGSVTVNVTITGATPGYHGMHIHQNGSCDPTTNDAGVVTAAGGAGGHWNPGDAGHGFPDAAPHHAGDMGNILINDAGAGTMTLTSTEWTVQGDGGMSVVGHAVVFHQGEDDGVSQPVGDAGPRPGCGVIQRIQ
jgi:Cu-Zn family superoxide dismutase